MSKVDWVVSVVSSKGNGHCLAAAIATKEECGNLGLVLPVIFNFSREAGNLDFHAKSSDFQFGQPNTFLQFAGH